MKHRFNLILVKFAEEPDKKKENDIFLSHITTIEALSEAGMQLALGGIIIKQYGLANRIQIISPLLSTFSQLKCWISRYTFKNYICSNFKLEPESLHVL